MGDDAHHRRNAEIRRRFDGRNYEALAAEYGLSVRQIRRLVDEPRSARRRRPRQAVRKK